MVVSKRLILSLVLTGCISIFGITVMLNSRNGSKSDFEKLVPELKRYFNSLKMNRQDDLTPNFDMTRIVKEELTPLLLMNISTRISLYSLQNIFYEEVLRTHIKCKWRARIGRMSDGGWDVCLDNISPQSCLVYAFGVGFSWDFDEQLSIAHKCTVRSFDPTLKLKDHVHQPGNVNFYAIGIGGKENDMKRKFPTETLLNLLKRSNEVNKTIDILKLDVEYSEWGAIEDMVKTGVLSRVKQFLIEFHTDELFNKMPTKKDYVKYIGALRGLEEVGFRKFNAQRNPGCYGRMQNVWKASRSVQIKQIEEQSMCNEASYLNIRYLPK